MEDIVWDKDSYPDELENFSDEIKNVIRINIEDVRNYSKMIIFLITDEYAKTETFKENLKVAQNLNKKIIFLLLENFEFNHYHHSVYAFYR